MILGEKLFNRDPAIFLLRHEQLACGCVSDNDATNARTDGSTGRFLNDVDA